LDVILRQVHEKIEGGFVRKREKPKYSMEGVYKVYNSFYYACEYIKKIDNATRELVCDDHQDEEKREGKILSMNEKRLLIKSKSLIFYQFSKHNLFIVKFIIYI
jgi:hypothetical protein